MRKVLFSVFAFLLFMVEACNKGSDLATIPNGNNYHAVSDSISLPDAAANLANPYDSLGYYHNIALQNTREVWGNKSYSIEAMYDSLSEYCTEMGWSNSETYAEVDQVVNSVNNDTSNSKVSFVNSLNLSKIAQSYAVLIFNLSYHSSDFDSYESYRDSMISLENVIMLDTSIQSGDKERLLKGASVARHSVLYWARENAGLNSDPTFNINPNGVITIGLWKKIHDWLHQHPIAAADIGGGMGGGALGGIGGVLLGAAGASLVAWAESD